MIGGPSAPPPPPLVMGMGWLGSAVADPSPHHVPKANVPTYACADGFSHKSRRDGRTDEHAAAYPRSHSLSDRTTHEHADAMPGGLLLPHLLRLHGVSEGLVQ